MRKNRNSSSPVRVSISAKNNEQKEMLKVVSENVITFVKGAPGTGKTYLAVSYALKSLLKKECRNIVFTRPVVEAGGEKLGFLPGSFHEKIDPYMIPIFETLSKIMPPELLREYMPKNGNGNGNGNGTKSPIRVLPLAYMRGLAQPLYSKIATPNGWVEMGNINPGDTVIGSDGKPVKVIQKFSHSNKKVYRVSFSDGTYTDCCDEHLWSTKTLSEKRHNKPFSVKSTAEISKSLMTSFRQKNHEIPLLHGPVLFKEKPVTVDPYVLGLLLGDGSLHESASISFSTSDTELIDILSVKLPDIDIKYSGQYDYRLTKKTSEKRNPLKSALRELSLLGTKSFSKFVPNLYKYNSPEVRLEVIRGLLDSDGCITTHKSGHRRIEFYSISDCLARDMAEMVRSLGGVAYMQHKKRKKTTSKIKNGKRVWVKQRGIRYIWCVDIVFDGANLFRLSRKANIFSRTKTPRPKRLILSVEYIGNMDCQCIQIDSLDKLYITDDFILTHNTFDKTFVICDEMQNATPEQVRMITTRLGRDSRMIICGDVYQTDIKRTNGLQDAFDILRDIDGIGFVTLSQEAIVRHPIIQDIENRYLNRDSHITPKVLYNNNKEEVFNAKNQD